MSESLTEWYNGFMERRADKKREPKRATETDLHVEPKPKSKKRNASLCSVCGKYPVSVGTLPACVGARECRMCKLCFLEEYKGQWVVGTVEGQYFGRTIGLGAGRCAIHWYNPLKLKEYEMRVRLQVFKSGKVTEDTVKFLVDFLNERKDDTP